MSETVEVPFGKDSGETATLLLAAAEELGHDPSVVRVSGRAFLVPSDVNDKAFGNQSGENKAEKKSAKKATAKKSQE